MACETAVLPPGNDMHCRIWPSLFREVDAPRGADFQTAESSLVD